LKISSISTGSMDSINNSHHVHEPLFTRVSHALRTFFMNMDKTQIAIVLSEAGDVEGAKALLDKQAK
jgi:hypothetical protein